MEFSQIIERQIAADLRRGFPVEFDTEEQQFDQLMADLVGLIGEVGEFANELKKVGLGLTNAKYSALGLRDAAPRLREELADAAIYLIRLSAGLGGNLEKDILAKMDHNDGRYRHLER